MPLLFQCVVNQRFVVLLDVVPLVALLPSHDFFLVLVEILYELIQFFTRVEVWRLLLSGGLIQVYCCLGVRVEHVVHSVFLLHQVIVKFFIVFVRNHSEGRVL